MWTQELTIIETFICCTQTTTLQVSNPTVRGRTSSLHIDQSSVTNDLYAFVDEMSVTDSIRQFCVQRRKSLMNMKVYQLLSMYMYAIETGVPGHELYIDIPLGLQHA